MAVTALGLLGGALGMAWHSSAILTSMQGDIAAMSRQLTIYHDQGDKDAASARSDTAQQIGGLDRRVTALETSRTDADRQLATTAASIAGLTAQTTAMQSAINDMRDGIRSIQQDIGTMARTANAPIRR